MGREQWAESSEHRSYLEENREYLAGVELVVIEWDLDLELLDQPGQETGLCDVLGHLGLRGGQ